MRINGRDAIARRSDSLIVAREGNVFVEIKGIAVPSFEEFNKLCPLKEAGWIQDVGGERRQNTETPTYQAYLSKRQKQFSAWLVLQTITEPSKIEWSTVKLEDPETWLGWKEELIAFGICAGECNKIETLVTNVNALSDESIQKAMNDFLAALQRELNEAKSSLQAAEETTKSSEPASVSESFHQG